MRKRKFWSVALATAVATMLPVSALAKTWDNVDSWDKLAEAFGDTDADVTIILTGDIQFAGSLEAKDGQTYILNGHTYTLSDVAFHGKGTAEVNADVQNQATDTALAVEDAKVTVNGDVKTDENGGGVGALGTADVTVNGNVDGTLGGVAATEESKITVNGDVDSDGVGALATDKGEVVVNGDVKGGEVGVAAEGESTVKVEGDVAGKDGAEQGGYGVVSTENAQVEVAGDVKGGNAESDTDQAVGGTGVIAAGESEVTVGGSVQGGDAKNDTVAMAGDGVGIEATADVTVKGDVKGGNAASKKQAVAGDGVVVLCLKAQDEEAKQAGKLVIEGSVSGGQAQGEDAIQGSALYYFFNQTQVPEDIIIPKLDSTSGQTLVDSLDGYLDGLIAYLEEISGESVSPEDSEALHQSFTDILVQLVLINHPDAVIADEQALISFLDTLPAEERALYASVFTDAIKAAYDPLVKQINVEILSQYLRPTVTVHALKTENGAEAVSSDMGAFMNELLSAEINYIVRVLPSENGVLTVDKETAKAGETITITAKANEGYRVSKVFVNGEALQGKDGVYTFTMPDHGDVEVSAEFVSTQSGAPKTGDQSQTALWAALLVLAGGAAFLTMKRRTNA